MKINWCKLGFHDWEQLDCIGKEQLKLNIIAKITHSRPLHIQYEGRMNYLVKKVCIRPGCNKIVDEIAEEEERIKEEYYRDKERHKQAKEIESFYDPNKIAERIENKDW